MRPTFVNDDGTESDSIRIIGARHPCVELQDDVEYIPNDYVLEREGSRLMLVTGPNMGGKSTYIRALGAIAVMAQVGSFVPASEARLCVLEMVLARVGASDATQRGISTFMAEMIDASAILASATSRSLVIIDELGRGTSTFDGFGLAWSISEYLLKRTRCFTLFATHYHELTQLDREQGVLNRHVTAHAVENGEITMLYSVEDGPCLDSFGIHVAQLSRFPPTVIASAKRKVAALEAHRAESSERAGKVAAVASAEQGGPPSCELSRLGKNFSGLPFDLYTSAEEKCAGARSLLAA